MRRILLIMAVLAVLIGIVSCNRNTQDTGEPRFERIIPAGEGFSEENETDAVEEVDLEPLLEAVQADPVDILARFSYMVGLRRSGRIADALEQAWILGEMEGDNPFKSIAYLNYAEMVLDEVPLDDPGRGELVQRAMDGLWIALGWEPESVPAHRALGRLALEAGDDDRAIHHLSITLTVVEIGYELRTAMAEIYIEREDDDKARAHLEAALRLAEEAEDRGAVRGIRGLMRGLN